MNTSLNARHVMPYMKVSYHIVLGLPHQCRFLNTRWTGSSIATPRVLCEGPGLLCPKSLSLMVGIGSQRNKHLLRLGVGPYAGHYRLGVAHCQHSEPFVRYFRLGLGLGPSFSSNLPQDNRPKDSEVLAEQISKNPIDTDIGFIKPNDTDAQLDVYGITNGDPILERKLKILILELDVFRQEGRSVPTPSLIKTEAWKELLLAKTRSARLKLLSFLWLVEMKKLKKKKVKKDTDKEMYVSVRERLDDDGGHLQYGLNNNSMFLRIYDTAINQHYNNKVIQAMQFGQKIVIDCDYDAHMTSHEAKNLAKQITLSFAENRLHEDPFNIYLCNANPNDKTLTQLQNLIKPLYEDHFPLNVTSKSYLELFPKEDIVYLTPHCREELTSYNHDSVYIIGGIVDKSNHEPLSLGKAKREGLKMGKLPLDHYLTWGSGSGKTLTINQMVQIMLTMKTTGDWAKALQYVPRRKIVNEDEPRENQNQNQFREKRRR